MQKKSASVDVFGVVWHHFFHDNILVEFLSTFEHLPKVAVREV
jgi:hypothetical protein